MFYHSLLSDWNHGSAHFLRGVVTELLARGTRLRVFEPRNAWSLRNLLAEHGEDAIRAFQNAYPCVGSVRYEPSALDLDRALDGVDLVLVHQWNAPSLVRRLGDWRSRNPGARLLFHDTGGVDEHDLEHYDGVLAAGEVIRQRHHERGREAWTWHQGVDTRVFHPIECLTTIADLVWIGNWGREGRGAELEEFLVGPVRTLGLRASAHGASIPAEVRRDLQTAGITCAGWLPNFAVPGAFARHRVTLHVPRPSRLRALPGVPPMPLFEALACGIPLVCGAWEDVEGLFQPGRDYLLARDGREARQLLWDLLHDAHLAEGLAEHGWRTILARHTCAHRVDTLLQIAQGLGLQAPTVPDPWPRRAPAARVDGGLLG